MSDASWPATWFDGRSAAGEAVQVSVEPEALRIVAADGARRVPLAAVVAGEPFEHAPRMLALADGSTLEVPDADRAFSAALADAGLHPSWIERMQRAWGAVLLAVAAVIALGLWAYVDGIPMAAGYAARAMPASIERSLGENVLELLDSGSLEPTELSLEHRARITARFSAAAAVAAPGVDVRVEFRRGQLNAFALPGGVIVLFDELVELAESDERLLGVLGHELGHVVHRHSTRQLFQALGTGALAGLIWGDFSAVVANAPVVLGVMRYGRAFEQEADAYSLEFLRANSLSPRPLYEFMTRVQSVDEKDRSQDIPDFLSTHPHPAERIEWLRRETEAYERREK